MRYEHPCSLSEEKIMIKLVRLIIGSPIFYQLICIDSKVVDKIVNKTGKQIRNNYFLIKVSNSLFWYIIDVSSFLIVWYGFWIRLSDRKWNPEFPKVTEVWKSRFMNIEDQIIVRFNKLWADMWQILNFITDTGNLSIVNLLRVRTGNQDLINWSMSWEAEKETSFLPSKVNSLAFINIVVSNVIIQSLDQTILCHIPVNGKFKFFSVSSLNCFELGRHSNYSCNWST